MLLSREEILAFIASIVGCRLHYYYAIILMLNSVLKHQIIVSQFIFIIHFPGHKPMDLLLISESKFFPDTPTYLATPNNCFFSRLTCKIIVFVCLLATSQLLAKK